jgi:putative copper resistance protein D
VRQSLAVLAIVILSLWLVGVAQSLSDATDWDSLITAVVTVLSGTGFGAVVIAQVATLIILVTVLMLGGIFTEGLASVAAIAVIVLEAMHGHAFSMGNTGLYIATILHLMAAGAWLGALPLLFWLVWRLPVEAASALLRAFSPVGQIAVLLIAVTALLQGFTMIQTLHSLLTTAYGWTALLKLLLFGLLLVFAGFNRVYGMPGLSRGTRRALLISLALENAAGLTVLLAAGLLASLPPVMAM